VTVDYALRAAAAWRAAGDAPAAAAWRAAAAESFRCVLPSPQLFEALHGEATEEAEEATAARGVQGAAAAGRRRRRRPP
jgi:hypothetical protein